ncbi:hypothetical protein J2Z19_002534 [Ensifer adhaerens]|uniref:Uncharacterized protein n=1 Tax=Ensifer adhaerens TaxID=106592 RepID=A0ACC5SVF1_ENSAD|nr:hypothetical protein [Ensifer adhaerens]
MTNFRLHLSPALQICRNLVRAEVRNSYIGADRLTQAA